MSKTIIPIASGKGGVGKTFLSANLGIALAELGKNVIIADLDFGGANMHTCLGLDNSKPGIGDFLRARYGELGDMMVQTEFENLKFLPGDVRSPFLANMHHAQKMRLTYNLKQLDFDFLILDLGAGSAYNTLDFFGITQLGMMITTTEHTSIMNMLMFLKLFAFRLIEKSLPKNTFLENTLKQCYNRSVAETSLTVSGLLDELAKVDQNAAQNAENLWNNYRPRIIFNQGIEPNELDVLDPLEKALDQNLSLKVDFFGYLFNDPTASQSMRYRKPIKLLDPESYMWDDITRLADRIVRLWDQPMKNSASLLRNNTATVYKQRNP